jgi:endonuclease/exonuclease/phosphatase family metal-dependent hydrolase
MSITLTRSRLHVTGGEPTADTPIEVTGFDAIKAPRSKLGDGRTLVVHNPSAGSPSDRQTLTMMSYNILLGGKRRREILEYFDRLQRENRLPDAIGIQEAHQDISIELAKRYGYHLAYFGHGDPGPPERTLINGKAILSRHPIREARHFTYALSELDRAATIERQRGNRFTDDEDRGVLRVTIELGDRLVDLHNTHLSYGDAIINADQFRQLRELIASSKHESILVGDFNANVGIKAKTGTDGCGETDTIEKYGRRYGTSNVGNIGDPAVLAQTQRLEQLVSDVWRPNVDRVVLGPGGATITPEEARGRLIGLDQRGPAWKLLKDAADGATFEGRPGGDGSLEPTGERMDAVFATPGLVPERVELDWSTNASDHVPLIARLRPETKAPRHTRRSIV